MGKREACGLSKCHQRAFPKCPPGCYQAHSLDWLLFTRCIGGMHPFLAHCLESSKHIPFPTKRSRGSSTHGWGEGTMLRGANPQGQDEGSRVLAVIQNRVIFQMCLYTQIFPSRPCN